MLMAHLDTVFSEETELRIKEKKGKWCCPGIGDDTANAAILLLLIKYVHEKVKKRSCGVWFVFDVGEEAAITISCWNKKEDITSFIPERNSWLKRF